MAAELVQPIRPCWHMRLLVPRMADGSLKGIVLKYANYHVFHCTRCRQALEALKKMLARLHALKSAPTPELPDDRWEAVTKGWAAVEQRVLEHPPD